MWRIKAETVFGFLILGIILTITLRCLEYSFLAKIFPLIVGVPGIMLIVGELIREIVFTGAKRQIKPDEAKDLREDKINREKTVFQAKKPPAKPYKKGSKEIDVFMWVIGLLGSIYFLGYLITIPLFLFFFLRFRASSNWLLSITVPIAMEVLVYVGFMMLLHIPLYEGLMFLLISGR